MAGIYARFGDIIDYSASIAKRTHQSFAATKRFSLNFFHFSDLRRMHPAVGRETKEEEANYSLFL
jgi:hypothetical protein